jgi:hypothetical protein
MPLDIFLILSCGVCSNRACTLSEKIAYHVISISKPQKWFQNLRSASKSPAKTQRDKKADRGIQTEEYI